VVAAQAVQLPPSVTVEALVVVQLGAVAPLVPAVVTVKVCPLPALMTVPAEYVFVEIHVGSVMR
jgi:hypothetical protein